MREFKFVILGIICFFFQLGFMKYLAIVSILPNLLLGYLFALNISLKLDWALIISFFIGLLFDLTQPHMLGFHAILFIVIGNVVNRYHHHIHNDNFMVILISSLLISIFYHFFWWLYYLFFESTQNLSFITIMISISYTSIISIGVSYAIILIDHLQLQFVENP